MVDREHREVERQADLFDLFKSLRRSGRAVEARRLLEDKARDNNERAQSLLDQEYPLHFSFNAFKPGLSFQDLVPAILALYATNDPRLITRRELLRAEHQRRRSPGQVPWWESLIDRPDLMERLRFALNFQKWPAIGAIQCLPNEAETLIDLLTEQLQKLDPSNPPQPPILLGHWLHRFLNSESAAQKAQQFLTKWTGQWTLLELHDHPYLTQQSHTNPWIPYQLSPSLLYHECGALRQHLLILHSDDHGLPILHPELQKALKDHWLIPFKLDGLSLFDTPERQLRDLIRRLQRELGDLVFAIDPDRYRFLLIQERSGLAAARKIDEVLDHLRSKAPPQSAYQIRFRAAVINAHDDPNTALAISTRRINIMARQRAWEIEELP